MVRRHGYGMQPPRDYFLFEVLTDDQTEEQEDDDPPRKPWTGKLVRIFHQVQYRPAGMSDEASRSPSPFPPPTATVTRPSDETEMKAASSMGCPVSDNMGCHKIYICILHINISWGYNEFRTEIYASNFTNQIYT